MQDLMPPVNTPDKLFHDGDPTQGIEGTIVTAEWLNNDQSAVRDIQQELINVLAAAAMQPDPAKQNQLVTAIQKILGDGISDGALLKENNLSDLADAALAVKNLNAVPTTRKINGHALDKDTNVTAQDIFNAQAVGLGDAADLNTITTPGLYYQPANAAAGTGKNYPEAVAGSLEVYKHAGITQIYRTYNNSRAYIRTLYGGAWTAWAKQYDAANKPTAGDVGALPASGGTINGNLTVKNTIQIGVVGSAVLNIGDNDSGLRSSKDGQVDLWANSKVVGNWNGTAFSFTGQMIPTNYTNFDARYQAKGNYTPAGQAYTKAESDGRFQPKGNYTPTGTAYTKAESDARYGIVSGIRRGGQQVRNPTDAWFDNWESPAGCVVTGIQMSGRSDGRKLGVYFRQMQYQNKQTGAWVNIGD